MPCSCAPSTMRASRLPIRSNSSHASSGAAVPTTCCQCVSPIAKTNESDSPPSRLFRSGFRPFFLLGAAYAGLGILIWLPLWFGDIKMPTAFSPLDWHIHEMLYGHVAAVMTGFLLTAIPNWTGRLPLQGGPLAALAALWIVGRVAVCLSQPIGALAAAVVAAGHPVEVVQGGALNFRWIALIV
jgi:NnrS protein